MTFDVCIKNGVMIPLSDAVLPVTNIEFGYGFGVYENVRVVRGNALFLHDHIERLFRSTKTIGLSHALTEKDITAWTHSLVQKCATDALNLKMLLIGARDPKDAMLFILPLAPLFTDKKLYMHGATAVTVNYERQFPDAKTLNMLGSYLSYRKAKEAGAYDALLIADDGTILEGTRTNFFLIKDRTITGAPLKRILEGVTMKHVLQIAREKGYQVREEAIRLADIEKADGAFLTSTSSKILPLTKIDDRTLAIPDALKELMKAFDDFLRQA